MPTHIFLGITGGIGRPIDWNEIFWQKHGETIANCSIALLFIVIPFAIAIILCKMIKQKNICLITTIFLVATMLLTTILVPLDIYNNAYNTDANDENFEYKYKIDFICVTINITAKTNLKDCEFNIIFLGEGKGFYNYQKDIKLDFIKSGQTKIYTFSWKQIMEEISWANERDINEIKIYLGEGLIQNKYYNIKKDSTKSLQGLKVYLNAIIFFTIIAEGIFAFCIIKSETKKIQKTLSQKLIIEENQTSGLQSEEKIIKCIVCGSDEENAKLCSKCKEKLGAAGIHIEEENKCVLCGANSGKEKLCEACRKKLKNANLSITEGKATQEIPNNTSDQNHDE